MATTMTYDLTYDAPLADVSAMLMDPGFREQVCAAQKAVTSDVQVTGDAGARSVVIDQVWATDRIPSFARKFAGDQINLVQTEHWSGADAATIDVVIPGKPGQMKGTIRLAESGGTTTETVAMEIKVSIPLVGGRIESMIADLLKRSLKSEGSVGRTYLAG